MYCGTGSGSTERHVVVVAFRGRSTSLHMERWSYDSGGGTHQVAPDLRFPHAGCNSTLATTIVSDRVSNADVAECRTGRFLRC